MQTYVSFASDVLGYAECRLELETKWYSSLLSLSTTAISTTVST